MKKQQLFLDAYASLNLFYINLGQFLKIKFQLTRYTVHGRGAKHYCTLVADIFEYISEFA